MEGAFTDLLGRCRSRMSFPDSLFDPEALSYIFGTGPKAKELSWSEARFTGKKCVVVTIGLHKTGKTTWVEKLLENDPGFEVFDEEKALEECWLKNNRNGLKSDYIREVFDDKLEAFLSNAKGSIVIDGDFLEIAKRAALFSVLRRHGFEIHVVYFNEEYCKRHPAPFDKNFFKESMAHQRLQIHNRCKEPYRHYHAEYTERAAIARALYDSEVQGSCEELAKAGRMDELWEKLSDVRRDVSQKRNLTVESISEYYDDPKKRIYAVAEILFWNYIDLQNMQFCKFHVPEQETGRLFHLGADFFHKAC